MKAWDADREVVTSATASKVFALARTDRPRDQQHQVANPLEDQLPSVNEKDANQWH